MGGLHKLLARARHRLGGAYHRAGGITRADIRDLQLSLGDQDAMLAAGIESLGHHIQQIEATLGDLKAGLATVERLQSIEGVSRWIEQATLRDHPLVSVILPTADRTRLVRRAIESVRAQRYEHWELLVVDDGDHEGAQAVVLEVDDARIRLTKAHGHGVAGARNAGLDLARGEIIAYIDDDNVMDRQWLYSVVWAFEQRPDVDVVYGGYIVDDDLRMWGESSGALPRTFLQAWSRDALRQFNLADIGAVAHRNGLSEGRFDERVQYSESIGSPYAPSRRSGYS